MEITRDTAVEILGLSVEERGDRSSIKRAYREIAKVIHPDLHGDLPSGRLDGIAKLVNSAYAVLDNGFDSQPTSDGETSGATAGAPAGAPAGEAWENPGQSWQSQTDYTRSEPERLVLDLEDLVAIYLTAIGPKQTTYGRWLIPTVASLRTIDTILIDTLHIVIGGVYREFPVRFSWKKNDYYTANIRLEIPGEVKFPATLNYTLASEKGELTLPRRGDAAFIVKISRFIQVRVNMSVV